MAYYRVPTTNKVIQMLDKRGRLEKVIDLVSSLPASPAEGDRYIDLTDNKVKEWNGSVWDEYTPKEGDNLYVLNRDKYYYFDGSEWKDVTEISSYWEKDGDTLKPKNASNVEITGSFIGDGSQLTGIKKLIEEFVAQGNVAAGDVVAFVNGKVKKGKMGSTKEIEGFGDEYVFNDYSIQGVSCSSLSENKFVVCYRDEETGYGTAIIGEVSGNTIVFGDEYEFANGASQISCSTLSDSKFVVCYERSVKGKAIIGEVSGNSIVFGDEYEFTSGNLYYFSCSALSDNKFVLCYSEGGTTDYGRAVIGEVSGNSIVFGDIYGFSDEHIYHKSCCSLSENKFVVCYNESSSRTIAMVGEVSGNSIVFGDEYVIYDDKGSPVSCSSLSDNKFVACCYTGEAVIGEVSGNSIVFGDMYRFEDVRANNPSTSALSESRFVVCYQNADYHYTAVVGEVLNNVITFGNKKVYNESNSNGYYMSCSSLSENKFVICYRNSGNNNYGTSIIGNVQQNEYNYIGISQETKSDGETVKVLIQGLSDIHFGLTVGQKYYATPEGDLTTDETEDYLGLAIAEDKLLLMDWQRPIMLYDEDNDEYVMPE